MHGGESDIARPGPHFPKFKKEVEYLNKELRDKILMLNSVPI